MSSRSRQHKREVFLIVVAFALASTIAFFIWQSTVAAARQLNESREELAEAQRMTSDIGRLKEAPRLAALSVEPPDEMSRRVTTALQATDAKRAALQSINPEQPIRVGKTEYQTRATVIEIDQIELTELARFAHELVQNSQGLEVRDILLSEPRQPSKTRETWLASLTVSQMIYSPRSSLSNDRNATARP